MSENDNKVVNQDSSNEEKKPNTTNSSYTMKDYRNFRDKKELFLNTREDDKDKLILKEYNLVLYFKNTPLTSIFTYKWCIYSY